MVALFLAARLLLAAVFAVAGLTKLRDRNGTRQTLVDFRTPARLTGPLAVLLPLAEVIVAVLLVPARTALYGAAGAFVLLAIFSAAIGWSLAHGRRPECHCFGQLHSTPASWRTLVRNGTLAAVAVIALQGSVEEPDTSATAWIGDLDGSRLVALVVGLTALVLLGLGTVAFLTLMRSYGYVLVRLDRLEAALADAGSDVTEQDELPRIGLEPGTAAPAFSAHSLRGDEVTLESVTSAGLPTLLLFTSPNCGPCQTLLPTASSWQEEHAGELQVVVVSEGPEGEIRAEANVFALDRVLVDEDGALSRAFEASGTPSAVLVSADGAIASWVASGGEWIERLVADATAEPAEDEGLPVGTRAPDVALTTLAGERVSVSELRGHDTLLLFWNPDCGFCRSMHEDLLAWEGSVNGADPRLVVVSSGDADSTRAEGFRSTVVLDETFEAGSAFGAGGTPMAVLIDAEGNIASGVVAGAEAVLTLARAEPA